MNLVRLALFICFLIARINSNEIATLTPGPLEDPAFDRQFQYQSPHPDPFQSHALDDTLLLASIDGKFHAVSRSTGHTLWSMASFPDTTSVSAPHELGALVRTRRTRTEEEEEEQETYIIEPQSGSIYILSSPSAPLQRFPLTMQELVDISPFTSSISSHETRVFVGRKETSLILLELETGRVKATLNSECPFVGWDTESEVASPKEEEDALDDEEDDEEHRRRKQNTKRKYNRNNREQISAPTEVYIGRTDYHISIYSKPSKDNVLSPPVSLNPHLIQNLSFSTYGPNNQDTPLQALYSHTQDGRYVQGLPNGEVIAFRLEDEGEENNNQKGRKGSEPLWGHRFGAPIVAIFDVLVPSNSSSSSGNKSPFVLLQPRPGIQDLFPSLGVPLSSSSSSDSDQEGTTSDDGPSPNPSSLLPNIGSAYVGLLEETQSLYAMSPERFPLVVFGGSGSGPSYTEQEGDNDSPPIETKSEHPTETERLLLLDKCHLNPFDPRCLVGIRPLQDEEEAGGEFGHHHHHGRPGLASGGGSTGLPIFGVGYPYRSLGSPYSSRHSYRHRYAQSGQPRKLLDGPSTAQVELPSRPQDSPPVSGSWSGPSVGEGQDGGREEERTSRSWFPSLAGILGYESQVASPSSGNESLLGNGERMVPVLESRNDVMRMRGLGALGLLFVVFWVGIVLRRKRNGRKEKPTKQVSLGEGQEEEEEDIEKDTTVQRKVPLELNLSSPALVDTPSNGELTSEPEQLGEKDDTGTPIAKPPHTLPTTAMTAIANGSVETPLTAASVVAVNDEAEESDGLEGDDYVATPGPSATPTKKKVRRGKRGKKKRGGTVATSAAVDAAAAEGEEKEKEKATPSLVLTTSSPKLLPVQTSLIVSDTILGFGSHGTVVLQGSLQGRSVAVKRLLRDFVTLAQREVSILQESDDHPNVIRYFYQETHENFLYIALELCPASLADVIESPQRDEVWMDINRSFEPKRALRQVTSGLRHLHGLKIVHRDIKPQNILISAAKGPVGAASGSGGGGGSGSGSSSGTGYRMLISDFGLCKKLDVDQTSFLPTAHGAHAAGTVGWRAPEILRGEVKLDDEEAGEDGNGSGSISSRGSVGTVVGVPSSSSKSLTRLTKSVDIFSLGCLFYYTLTNGGHPYGDRFEREVNIMKDAKDVSSVERFGEEGMEAKMLILGMVEFEARKRPDTHTILQHPYFWDSHKRLNFLQDASDRFEIMCRDPKDPHLLTLEKGAVDVVGNDWHSRLDKVFVENLGKYRKYDGKSVQDLMRALRNKKHHYQDLPDHVKRHLGPMPEGFLAYFTKRYPRLFLHVYGVVKGTALDKEPMFRRYFEVLGDS